MRHAVIWRKRGTGKEKSPGKGPEACPRNNDKASAAGSKGVWRWWHGINHHQKVQKLGALFHVVVSWNIRNVVIFLTPTKPSRSLDTHYAPNEKNTVVLRVAMWQPQLLIKPILSYPPPPNTHTQLSFSKSWGDWKPDEAKFPTSQAVCSCHYAMASLLQRQSSHHIPAYQRPPQPQVSLMLTFCKTFGKLLVCSWDPSPPYGPFWVTLFLIPNFWLVTWYSTPCRTQIMPCCCLLLRLACAQCVPDVRCQPAWRSQWPVHQWDPAFLWGLVLPPEVWGTFQMLLPVCRAWLSSTTPPNLLLYNFPFPLWIPVSDDIPERPVAKLGGKVWSMAEREATCQYWPQSSFTHFGIQIHLRQAQGGISQGKSETCKWSEYLIKWTRNATCHLYSWQNSVLNMFAAANI